MKVDKTTTVNVRFYGGGELENGVAYEAIPPGATPPAQRVELCDRTIPKGLKGLVNVTVAKEGARKPVLEMCAEVAYVKNPDAVVKLFYSPASDARAAEIRKAESLYNAPIDTVILMSLTQGGASESYKCKLVWTKEEEPAKERSAETSAKKKAGRGRKAAKKSAGSQDN